MAKFTIHDDKLKGSTSIVNQSVNEDIEVIIPDKDGMLLTAGNISANVIDGNITSGFILKPKGLVAPIQNPGAFDGELFVQDFETTPNFTGKHTATQWKVSLDENFENVAIDYTENDPEKLLTYRPMITNRNTRIFVKYRFISDDIASVYSDVISYVTPSGSIGIPVITHEDKTYTTVLKTEPIKIIGDLEATYLKETHWIVRRTDNKKIVFEKKTIDKRELTQIEIPEKVLEPIYEYQVEVIHYSNRYGIYSLPGYHTFRPSFFGIKKPEIKLDEYGTSVYFNVENLYLDHYKEAEWEVYGVVSSNKKLLVKISDEFQKDQYITNGVDKSVLVFDKYLTREDIKDSKFDKFLIKAKIIGFQYDSPVDEFELNKEDVMKNIRNVKLDNSLNEWSLPKLKFTIEANNFVLERVGDSNLKNDIDLIVKSDKTKIIANFKRTGELTGKKAFDITHLCKLSGIAKTKEPKGYDIILDFSITPEVLSYTDNFCYPYSTTPDTLFKMENMIKDITLTYFVNGRTGTRRKDIVLEMKDGAIPVNVFDKELLHNKGKMVFENLKNDDLTISYERGVVENQKWNKTKSVEFKIFDKETGGLVTTINKTIPEDKALDRRYIFNLNEALEDNKLIVENHYILKAVLTSQWLQFDTVNIEFKYPKKELIPAELSVTGLGKKQTVKIINNPMLNIPGDPWSFTKYYLYDANGKMIFNIQLKGKVDEYLLPWDKLEINSDFIIGCTVISNDVESEEGRCKFTIGDVKLNYSELEFYSKGIINYNEPVGAIHGYTIKGANDEGSVFKYIDIEYYLGNKLITKGKINIDKENYRFVIGGKKLNMELEPDKTYKVRCRVGCDWYYPSDWKDYEIKTSEKIIDTSDGMIDLGSGDWVDGGVFGSVDREFIAPTSEEFGHQIALREYCGEWGDESQFRCITPDKYSVTTNFKVKYDNIYKEATKKTTSWFDHWKTVYNAWGIDFDADGYKGTGELYHWSYKKGDRVSYKDKLYEALKDQSWKQFEPDKFPDAWKLIKEDLLLPSEVEVLDNMGINWNYDNSKTVSVTPINDNSLTRVSIGGRVTDINKSGWTKMLSPTTKKICYISTQPFLSNVALNDILSRHKEYGLIDRFTLRFGTRLYYVRLASDLEMMFLKEYEALAKSNTPTLKDDQTYDCKFNTASFTCYNELPDGLDNKAMAYGNTAELTGNSGVKTGFINMYEKIGSLRLVITPIKEELAPYNFLGRNLPHPNMRIPFDNNFVYDKFTDTGFLGISKPMMDFNTFVTELGIVGQVTQINRIDNIDKDPYQYWIGRYYHGLITIEPINGIGSNFKFNLLSDNGLIYGYNNGYKHKKAQVIKSNDVEFSVELPTYLRRNHLTFNTVDNFDFRKDERVTRKFSTVAKSLGSEMFRNLSVKQAPRLNTNEVAGLGWYLPKDQLIANDDHVVTSLTVIGKHFKSDIELHPNLYGNRMFRTAFKNDEFQTQYDPGVTNFPHHVICKDTIIEKSQESYVISDRFENVAMWSIERTANETGSKLKSMWLPVLVANIDLSDRELRWDDEDDANTPKKVCIRKNMRTSVTNLKEYMISAFGTKSYRKEILELGSRLGRMINTSYDIYVKTKYPHFSDYRLNELSQVSLVLMKGFIPQVKHPLFYCFTSNAQTFWKELMKYGLDPKKYIDQVIWIDDLKIFKETKADKFKGKWFEKDISKYPVDDKLLIEHAKELFISNSKLNYTGKYDYKSVHGVTYNAYENVYDIYGPKDIIDKKESYSIYRYAKKYYDYANELETPDDFNFLNRFVLLSELEEFLLNAKEELYVKDWKNVLPNLTPDMNGIFEYLYDKEKIAKLLRGMFIVNDLKLDIVESEGFILSKYHKLEPELFYHPCDYNFKIGTQSLLTFIKSEIYKQGLANWYSGALTNKDTLMEPFAIDDAEKLDSDPDESKNAYHYHASRILLDPKNYISRVSYYIPKHGMKWNNTSDVMYVPSELYKVGSKNNLESNLTASDSLVNDDLVWGYVFPRENNEDKTKFLNKLLSETLADNPNCFFASVTSSEDKAKSGMISGSRFNKFNIFVFNNIQNLIQAYYNIRRNVDILEYLIADAYPNHTLLINDNEERRDYAAMKLFTHLMRCCIIKETPITLNLGSKQVYNTDYDNINEKDNKNHPYDYYLDAYGTVINNNEAWLMGSLGFPSVYRDNLSKIKISNIFDSGLNYTHDMGKKYVKSTITKDVKFRKKVSTIVGDVSDVKTDTHDVIDFIDPINKSGRDLINVNADARTLQTNINYPYKAPIVFDIQNEILNANNINYTVDDNNVKYTAYDSRTLESNGNRLLKNKDAIDEITYFSNKSLTNMVSAYTYVTNPMFSKFDFIDVDNMKKVINTYRIRNHYKNIVPTRIVGKNEINYLHDDLKGIVVCEMTNYPELSIIWGDLFHNGDYGIFSTYNEFYYSARKEDKSTVKLQGFVPMELADDLLWFIDEIIDYRDELLNKGFDGTITEDIKSWAKSNYAKYLTILMFKHENKRLMSLNRNKYKEYIDSISWLDATGQIVYKYYKPLFVDIALKKPTATNKDAMEHIIVDKYTYKANYLFHPYERFNNYKANTIGKSLGNVLNINNNDCLISKTMIDILNIDITTPNIEVKDLEKAKATDKSQFDLILEKEGYFRHIKRLARIEQFNIAVAGKFYSLYIADIRYMDDIFYYFNRQEHYKTNPEFFRTRFLNYFIWVNRDRYGQYIPGITEFLEHSRTKANLTNNLYLLNNKEVRSYRGKKTDLAVDKKTFLTSKDNNTLVDLTNEVTLDTIKSLQNVNMLSGDMKVYGKITNKNYTFSTVKVEDRILQTSPYSLNYNRTDLNKLIIPLSQFNNHRIAIRAHSKKYPANVNNPINNAYYYDDIGLWGNKPNQDISKMNKPIYDYITNEYMELEEFIYVRLNYTYLPDLIPGSSGVSFKETINSGKLTAKPEQDRPYYEWYNELGSGLAKALNYFRENNKNEVGAYYIKRLNIENPDKTTRPLLWNIGGFDHFFNVINWNYVKYINHIPELEMLRKYNPKAVKLEGEKITMGVLRDSDVPMYYDYLNNILQNAPYNITDIYTRSRMIMKYLIKVLVWINEPKDTDETLENKKTLYNKNKTEFTIDGAGLIQHVVLDNETVVQAKNNIWLSTIVRLYNSKGELVNNQTFNNTNNNFKFQLPPEKIELNTNQLVEVQLITKYSTFEVGEGRVYTAGIKLNYASVKIFTPGSSNLDYKDLRLEIKGLNVTQNDVILKDKYTIPESNTVTVKRTRVDKIIDIDYFNNIKLTELDDYTWMNDYHGYIVINFGLYGKLKIDFNFDLKFITNTEFFAFMRKQNSSSEYVSETISDFIYVEHDSIIAYNGEYVNSKANEVIRLYDVIKCPKETIYKYTQTNFTIDKNYEFNLYTTVPTNDMLSEIFKYKTIIMRERNSLDYYLDVSLHGGEKGGHKESLWRSVNDIRGNATTVNKFAPTDIAFRSVINKNPYMGFKENNIISRKIRFQRNTHKVYPWDACTSNGIYVKNHTGEWIYKESFESAYNNKQIKLSGGGVNYKDLNIMFGKFYQSDHEAINDFKLSYKTLLKNKFGSIENYEWVDDITLNQNKLYIRSLGGCTWYNDSNRYTEFIRTWLVGNIIYNKADICTNANSSSKIKQILIKDVTIEDIFRSKTEKIAFVNNNNRRSELEKGNLFLDFYDNKYNNFNNKDVIHVKRICEYSRYNNIAYGFYGHRRYEFANPYTKEYLKNKKLFIIKYFEPKIYGFNHSKGFVHITPEGYYDITKHDKDGNELYFEELKDSSFIKDLPYYNDWGGVSDSDMVMNNFNWKLEGEFYTLPDTGLYQLYKLYIDDNPTNLNHYFLYGFCYSRRFGTSEREHCLMLTTEKQKALVNFHKRNNSSICLIGGGHWFNAYNYGVVNYSIKETRNPEYKYINHNFTEMKLFS